MATIIGKDKAQIKQITCSDCASIIEYTKNEVVYSGYTDEGVKVMMLPCPCCLKHLRTTP